MVGQRGAEGLGRTPRLIHLPLQRLR